MAATGNEAVTLEQLKMLFEGAEDTGSALDALESQIVLMQGDIENNNVSLAQLQLDVENNTSSLSTLQGDIENNTASLTHLQEDIETNTSSLSQLQESVVDNTSSVAQLQTKVDECFTSVSEGKSLIAAAVTDSGIQTAADATFATMATNAGNIVGQFSDELDLIIGGDITPVPDAIAWIDKINGEDVSEGNIPTALVEISRDSSLSGSNVEIIYTGTDFERKNENFTGEIAFRTIKNTTFVINISGVNFDVDNFVGLKTAVSDTNQKAIEINDTYGSMTIKKSNDSGGTSGDL